MEGCPGRGPARAGPLATQVEEMLFSAGATLRQHLPLLPSKYHVATSHQGTGLGGPTGGPWCSAGPDSLMVFTMFSLCQLHGPQQLRERAWGSLGVLGVGLFSSFDSFCVAQACVF